MNAPVLHPDIDPHAPVPDARVEFPGVSRWFELRRRANQEREALALVAFEAMRRADACDVPLAGADWPYGQPVDVDVLHALSERHGVLDSQYRIYAIPDPPGTVLRVRRGEGDAALDFARALCASVRDREIAIRSERPAPPFAALCAHFAGRTMDVRWMGAFAPAGLARTAPPDSVAQAMAAFASSLVMDLPYFAADPMFGEPRLDVPLDTSFGSSTPAGRERLDAALDVVRQFDPRLALRVEPGPPDGHGPQWHVCGFSEQESGVDPVGRSQVLGAVNASVAPLPMPPQRAGPRRTDDRFLARVGHGTSTCLARAPHDASLEELALSLVAEHGLSCGHDARVQRYAAMLAATGHLAATDMLLALDRLGAIDGDPCRAVFTRAAVADYG